MATSTIQLSPIIKYSDEVLNISQSANTWGSLGFTNDTPSGYRPFNVVLQTASTVDGRNQLMMMCASFENFSRAHFYARANISGTVTIRKYYIKEGCTLAI